MSIANTYSLQLTAGKSPADIPIFRCDECRSRAESGPCTTTGMPTDAYQMNGYHEDSGVTLRRQPPAYSVQGLCIDILHHTPLPYVITALQIQHSVLLTRFSLSIELPDTMRHDQSSLINLILGLKFSFLLEDSRLTCAPDLPTTMATRTTYLTPCYRGWMDRWMYADPRRTIAAPESCCAITTNLHQIN